MDLAYETNVTFRIGNCGREMAGSGSRAVRQVFETVHHIFRVYVKSLDAQLKIKAALNFNSIFIRHNMRTRCSVTEVNTFLSVDIKLIWKVWKTDVFTAEFMVDYLTEILQWEVLDEIQIALVNAELKNSSCGVRIDALSEVNSPEGSDEDVLLIDIEFVARMVKV